MEEEKGDRKGNIGVYYMHAWKCYNEIYCCAQRIDSNGNA